MGISEIIAIGAGLAADAACVAITNGIGVTEKKKRLSFLNAFLFGLFQGIMPIIGSLTGSLISGTFSYYSHLIVAGIFFFLGGKSIYDALKEKELVRIKTLPIRLLLLQAIATSMDALAVGVSFSLSETPILSASFIIGSITFLICLPAFWLGDKSRAGSDQKAEITGGVILLLIGVKSLLKR